MKKCKRWLVLALAVVLICSQCRVNTFAAGVDEEVGTSQEYVMDADAASETEDACTEPETMLVETEDSSVEGISIQEPDVSPEEGTEEETIPDHAALQDAPEDKTEDPDVAKESVEAENSAESEDFAETDISLKTYCAQDQGVKVTAVTSSDALPEGAVLEVEVYDTDSSAYHHAAEVISVDTEEQAGAEESFFYDNESLGCGLLAMDISFVVDGEEVEPTEEVQVSIDVSEVLPSKADAATLKVQHLVEKADDVVDAVVVADDSDETSGTIDAKNAVAEFTVDSFSDFTVTWEWAEQSGSTSSVSLTVTAYLDGVELEGLNDIDFDSQDDELNLETMLNDEDFGTGDYTFDWAYITYTRSGQGAGGGNQTTTLGTEKDPVLSIEKTSGGQSSFIVIQESGTSNTVQSDDMHLYAYYTTPQLGVAITPVEEDEAEDWLLEAQLSHAGDYTDVTYAWSVTATDGTATPYAEISWSDETGRAFVIWEEGVTNGTEVLVQVTATVTREDGSEETVTAKYILEYGDENINIAMTYGPDQTALPEGVKVTLTNTVTGWTETVETDENGEIHDAVEPGIYVVEATYTVNGSNYSCKETVAMADAGNYRVNLNYADADKTAGALDSDKTDWNHVDIKLALGSSGSDSSAEGVTVAITSVLILSSEGTVKYTATEDSIEAGASDNEWQVYFYTGNATTGTYSHTLNFATTDKIQISYTLYKEDTEETTEATISIDASTVYSSGTTYPANGQRAYKLYNYLYGTSYSSNAQLMAAGVESIDISDMSMMLVAAILCDSSTTGNGAGVVTGTAGMWGMDFALSIETFMGLSTSWTLNLEKTYENQAMTAGMFTFNLYNAAVKEDGSWSLGTLNSTMTNQTAGRGANGNATDTISYIIPYDDEDVTEGITYYYILSEEKGDIEDTIYDDTVFGAKVEVGVDGDVGSQTYGEAIVTVTYYILTADGDGSYTATEFTGEKLTFNDSGEPTFHFVNVYSTDVPAETVNVSGMKTWDDIDDQNDIRPGTIMVSLYADGEPALDEEGKPIFTEVLPDAEGIWSWSFDSLPKENEDGSEIVYTVKEEAVDGYITIYDDNGYDITNALAPSVSKYVSDTSYGESTEENLEKDEAENNDTMEYKIIADHIGNVTNLVIHEALDAQLPYDTLEIKSVKLYQDSNDEGTELTEDYYMITDPTCTLEDSGVDCTFEIHIADDVLGTDLTAEAYIEVILDVQLSESADRFDDNNMTDAIDNNASLSFDVNGSTTYADPVETETYSYGFSIYKYGEANMPLAGAAFMLSREDSTDGTQFAIFEESVDEDSTWLFQGWTDNSEEATALVSAEDGNIHIEGLHEGTYAVTETEAPEGYTLLDDSITVAIVANEDYQSSIVVNGETIDGYTVGIENELETLPEDPDNPNEPNPDDPDNPTEPDLENPDNPDNPNGSDLDNPEVLNPDTTNASDVADNATKITTKSKDTDDENGEAKTSESTSAAKTSDAHTTTLYTLLLAVCLLAVLGVRTSVSKREAREKRNNTRL